MLEMDVSALRATLEKCGQTHLLHFWNDLTSGQQKELWKELESIDVPKMTVKFRETMHLDDLENGVNGNKHIDDIMKPPPSSIIGSVGKTPSKDLERYEKIALKEISEGRVGVILLAGGQGTRLGVTYPKGMYDLTLPSRKTLYQIQAERIRRLEVLAERETGKRASIPWYIMTSDSTREPTLDFFRSHNHFGLNPSDIITFDQGTAPCFDLTGRILLATPSNVRSSPDGNGGLYSALRAGGALDDMNRRGLTCVHVYCVDNVLVKVADPVFMGFCISEGADCAAKVVPKAYAEEPVGVVCDVGGKFQVVEYSEIQPDTAARRDETGELVFSAGNICNHFFTVEFLNRVTSPENEDQLAYHPAKKKIPCMDPETGASLNPKVPNGIKLEKFVFDVFAFAKNFRLWEVDRDEEFSPVKNADGAAKDTPSTARKMLYERNKAYVLKAGGEISVEDEDTEVVVEISPLTSYAGEDLEELVKGKRFETPVVL